MAQVGEQLERLDEGLINALQMFIAAAEFMSAELLILHHLDDIFSTVVGDNTTENKL